KQTLPLSSQVKSVAGIGTDAVEARLGGYSGPGKNPVSILQGMREKSGQSVLVSYAAGCGRTSNTHVVVSAENLFHDVDGKREPGLLGTYFNNIALEGEPALTRVDRLLDFQWTLFSPDQEKINADYYAVRWTGKLLAPESGTFEIGLAGDDGYRLYINNMLVIDNWRKQSVQQVTKPFVFEKGKDYDLRVEFYETVGNVRLKLIWNVGVEERWKREIENAVALTKASDVVIVVAGIEEGEFRDRAFLS